MKSVDVMWLYEANVEAYNQWYGKPVSLDMFHDDIAPMHRTFLERLEAIIERETGDKAKVVYTLRRPYTAPLVQGYEVLAGKQLPMHWCSIDGLFLTMHDRCPWCANVLVYVGKKNV